MPFNRTMFRGMLQVSSWESRNNNMVSLTDEQDCLIDVDLAAILTLACGFHRVPVNQSESHCRVAELYVGIRYL